MDKKIIGYALGRLLLVIAAVFLIPLAMALFENRMLGLSGLFRNPVVAGFLAAISVSLLSGAAFTFTCRKADFLHGGREGFAIVSFGWLALAFVGCVPLFAYLVSVLDGKSAGTVLRCFTDAYFETMSGFTTTGATILTDIESVPRSLLFWRSLTHWLGGMGIITLALVIFPTLGVSGYQMFRGEVPGPTAEKLQPRLNETARILWGVYVLLSAAEIILLFLGGMPLFESFCHTFGTMATGGFSTLNSSVGGYRSHYVDWVITLFMFLAGVNFLIHYRVIIQRQYTSLRNNRELHFYIGTLLIAIVFITGVLYTRGTTSINESQTHYRNQPLTTEEMTQHLNGEKEKLSSLYSCFRYSAFQVISIVTTTGYCTADFDVWPDVCRFVLVVLMFWGGCIGSTGGGIKMGRILILLKAGLRETYKMIQPRLIAPLKVQNEKVEEELVTNILGFAILFVSIFILCSFLMSMIVPDMVTAITTVAATLCNIGPGLGGIGATQTYAWIALPGKWVLIFCMLLGRLEVFTVLTIFLPSIWRK